MKSKINTRQRILVTAKEQFVQFGYSKVKTDDLVKSIGISKRTLYQNFSSKKEILTSIIDEYFADTNSEIERIITDSGKGTNIFLEILREMLELKKCNLEVFSDQFLSDLSQNQHDVYEDFLQYRESIKKQVFDLIYDLGLKDGYIKEHLNKQVVFQMLFNTVDNYMKQENVANMSVSINEVVSTIHEILLTGTLKPEKQAEFTEKF